jgi:hypothetical protein
MNMHVPTSETADDRFSRSVGATCDVLAAAAAAEWLIGADAGLRDVVVVVRSAVAL